MLYTEAMTYSITTGSAFQVDEPLDGNVRNYTSANGDHFIGHDTNDVEYTCDQTCQRLVLEAHGLPEDKVAVAAGSWVALAHDGDSESHLTADWGATFGDWPDYTVHCAACGEILHEVDDED